jgi:hypothetical protein
VVSISAAMKRCRWQRLALASWSRAVLPIRGRGLDHMGMAAPIYCTGDMVRALSDDGNRDV